MPSSRYVMYFNGNAMVTTYFIKRSACPVCHSTRFETIYSCGFLESPIRDYLDAFFPPVGYYEPQYLTNAQFAIVECYACGLIFQEEIPNDFLSSKLYEEWIDPQKTYEKHDKEDDLARFAQYAQEVMMLIAYFQTRPSQLKFFDFGMGWAKWSRMAKAFGCDSYGSELSKVRIENATSQGLKVISWSEIPDHSFDFINANQVFEHLSEPLETLNHLKQALKPHGLIKICVPDGKEIKRALAIGDWTAPLGTKNSLNPVSPLEHINCFNHYSLKYLAEKAGLELVKIPIIVQYHSSTNWQPIKPLLRNVFRPIYRNFIQKNTYLFFRLKRSQAI